MQSILMRAALIAPLLFLAGCEIGEFAADSSRYKEDFQHSYDFKPGSRLSVENFNGSIEISTWERDSVEIVGTKFASTEDLLKALKVDIVAVGDAVRIRTVRPSERTGNMGCRYLIRVPARTELERISSTNGSIRVEGVEGSIRLRTSNGSIRGSRLNGNLEVQTTNGSVDVREISGFATLRTSNGAIRADEVRGALEANTTNGGINVRLLEPLAARAVRLETSNGGIDLTMESARDNQVRARTTNASITVRLPSDLGARVIAETTHGQVSSDFDVNSSDGRAEKNRLEGVIGKGGPTLDLSTSNGNIKLLKLRLGAERRSEPGGRS